MKILKKLILFLALLLAALVGTYLLVVQFNPSFGGDLSTQQRKDFQALKNFQKGTFVNRRAVPEPLTFSKFIELGYALSPPRSSMEDRPMTCQ